MKKATRARPAARRKTLQRGGGRKRPAVRRPQTKALDVHELPAEEIEALRAELERALPAGGGARWNVDPEDVQRSVARLVLTLMEFIRQLLERQAIRRMESQTLTDEQVEAVGLALMRLEDTLKTMGQRFGLGPDDLNLDLGPLGRLI
jgi:hypothetical protein